MSLAFSRILQLSPYQGQNDSTFEPAFCGSWAGFATVEHPDHGWQHIPELVQCYGMLSDTSRWRCDRFRDVRRQAQFLLARCIVLRILREQLGMDTTGLVFDQLENGQPTINLNDGSVSLRISLAHSENVAAAAVSSGSMMAGIDVEFQTRLSVPALQFMLGELSETGTSSTSELCCSAEQTPATEWEVRKEWLRREAKWKAQGGPSSVSVLEMPSLERERKIGTEPAGSADAWAFQTSPGGAAHFTWISSSATLDGDFRIQLDEFSHTSFVACVCQIQD